MLLASLRKLLFEIETLPPAPPADSGAVPRRPSRLGLIVAPEELPLDPVSPPLERRNWLRLLLGPETLEDLEPVPRRPSGRGLGWLLAAEDLGPEPEAVPGARRGRWLEWLFSPEQLDDSPRDPK
jgi:hypothetical protein